MSHLRIGIIVGSTRPGRKGLAVGEWVKANAKADGVEFELVDLADYALPILDEALPAGMGQYQHAHTRAWANRIDEFDGYIFVTPEYNHSLPGSLKNALDFVAAEWHNKAAGIVSYGSMGGVRANEHLRQILAELEIADVRQNVMLSIFTDWKNFSEFAPADLHLEELQKQVDQIAAWAGALKPLRAEDESLAA
ncbi:NAD(P)H-dependent FMN reductase [Cryobacterium mesophilum]|uniref:NADPH-dependent oxidoreductase n=1 Tax=Terrimesophilobacter mesophilus TaxID=433647 RepID=A0A4V3I9K3_9MICO|nr:NAD(P)H-dependent oxidoreductase [Terrimesophilobacter mesophilus]MBB5633022.1 NAD(P)H-dependent FMN reductase [Terrimesophilobacter mesophilus]TFB79788.1 NADPH-dependent oxidoreductase [Terrimesophilobacter mesophilus]